MSQPEPTEEILYKLLFLHAGKTLDKRLLGQIVYEVYYLAKLQTINEQLRSTQYRRNQLL